MQQEAVFRSGEVDGARWQDATFHFDLQPLGVVLGPERDGRLRMQEEQQEQKNGENHRKSAAWHL